MSTSTIESQTARSPQRQGIEEIGDVRGAYMEGDGGISVVSQAQQSHEKPQHLA
jgi:uncharacterized membrane protein YcaP (DUF421 family)